MGNNVAMAKDWLGLAFSFAVSLAAHVALFSQLLVGEQAISGSKPVLVNARLLPLRDSNAPVEIESLIQSAGEVGFPPGDSVAIRSRSARLPSDSLVRLPQFTVDSYLPVSKLTIHSSPIDSIDPTPAGFSLEGVVGEVELMLLISSEGEVDAVLTIRSTLPPAVAEYAAAAFKSARFSPGYVNNTAVRSRVRFVLSPNPSHVDPETGNPLSAKNRRR